jgi:hypothetical protein
MRSLAYLSETLWPIPLGMIVMIVTYSGTEVPADSLAASMIARSASTAAQKTPPRPGICCSRTDELAGHRVQEAADYRRGAAALDRLA